MLKTNLTITLQPVICKGKHTLLVPMALMDFLYEAHDHRFYGVGDMTGEKDGVRITYVPTDNPNTDYGMNQTVYALPEPDTTAFLDCFNKSAVGYREPQLFNFTVALNTPVPVADDYLDKWFFGEA